MSELKQLSGCKKCSLSRKEMMIGRQIHITSEVCRWGGLIAKETGSSEPFKCSK